jgi:hypothetical protein
MRARRRNAELKLIELVAGEIQEDERLLDALGDGSMSLEDVERWQRRRRGAAPRFADKCGRAVAEMRRQGFGRTMRRGGGRFPHRAHGMAAWD